MSPAEPPHGSYARYIRGCRCQACRHANARRSRADRQRRKDAQRLGIPAASLRDPQPSWRRQRTRGNAPAPEMIAPGSPQRPERNPGKVTSRPRPSGAAAGRSAPRTAQVLPAGRPAPVIVRVPRRRADRADPGPPPPIVVRAEIIPAAPPPAAGTLAGRPVRTTPALLPPGPARLAITAGPGQPPAWCETRGCREPAPYVLDSAAPTTQMIAEGRNGLPTRRCERHRAELLLRYPGAWTEPPPPAAAADGAGPASRPGRPSRVLDASPLGFTPPPGGGIPAARIRDTS